MKLISNLFVLIFGFVIFGVLTAAAFALPPMLMYFDQLSSVDIVKSIMVVIVLCFAALLFTFVFTRTESSFGRIFKYLGIFFVPFLFAAGFPLILVNLAKIF